MESVVITGGNGYIGSHMCKLMHSKGYQVHIIDNHSTSPDKPVHSYGVFHRFDIADKEKVQALLEKIRPVAVFHFAARAVVPESEADPILYYNENLVKTIALLDSCLKKNVRKFIFSSTCATFKGEGVENLSETTLQAPSNTYGKTKFLMEMVMRDLAQKKLIDVIVFRYFNASGCSPTGDIGENHIPESHLIPSIIKAHLSNGKSTFKIFGDKFPTADGTCIRDYIHVDDLVEAHYQGLKYLQDNAGFHDFNLGSEKGYSVKEVVCAFEEVVGTTLHKEIMEARAGDPPRLVGDSTKAKKHLGFFPKYTLRQSIEHAWKYFQKQVQ